MNLFLPNNNSLPRIVFFIISALWLKFNVSSSYFCWQNNVRILVICDAYTVVAWWKETFASEHNLYHTECLLRSLNCIIVRLSPAAFIGFMPNCYYYNSLCFYIISISKSLLHISLFQTLVYKYLKAFLFLWLYFNGVYCSWVF